MNHFGRIYTLHKILCQSRRPVPLYSLQEETGYSRATINRIIRELRENLFAPLEYDREANGYYYEKTGEHPYELPGLWFNASEVYALLSAQQLLAQIQPGLLEGHINPLRKRIEKIIKSECATASEVGRRVRILHMTARQTPSENFQTAASALLQRKQLHIHYHGRARNEISTRDISPQRLTHYRDNWYLDAWCHQSRALRSFSVDRIRKSQPLEQIALEISDTELDAHFANAYGIFAGPATHTAILRFTPERARWVADEQWHPEQQSHWLTDGRYELTVPYSNDKELIMDILKYGADVEVIAPDALIKAVKIQIDQARSQYG
ncbi:MAG: WYL domain-containing protein [Gammaproteobacteria bacterium]